MGFAGFGGGAPGLSYKSAATKTYVDDVFSTYAYEGKGDNTTNSVSNNVDLTEGGMVWTKARDITYSHIIYDSLRGQNYLTPNENYAQLTDSRSNVAFNSTGYTFGDASTTSWGPLNEGNRDFVSWSFRKAKGFFDLVTYTGDGVNGRTVSHSLGSVPGMILVKNLSDSGGGSSDSWAVYHRDIGNTHALRLDTTAAAQASANWWYNTTPTSTEFTLGYGGEVNGNGSSYVAYVFAGGASDAATARSVDFDGNDYLSIPVNNSDFDWAADGSLTIEAFVNMDAITGQTYNSIINRWGGSGTYSFGLDIKSNGNLFFYRGNGSTITTHESSGITIGLKQWHHIAVVKDGTTGRFFINGQSCGTFSWNEAFTNSTSIPLHLGNLSDGNSYPIDGKISNARFVNGTALYTSSFRAPTEPLTNITNTKLLCCNNSSTTGSTVTPGTITANGDPTASTNSPFDDTAAHIFGEDGDKNITSCGIYTGNGSDDGPEINLGWEPQWILLKRTDSTDNWPMYDVMRGIATGGTDNQLRADQNAVEHTTGTTVDVTSTGFKITTLGSEVNANNGEYVYVAIRRPDGYVGKPPSAGTDVFAMDTGAGSSTIPNFDSTFPVDFGLVKLLEPWNATEDWYACNRLITKSFVQPSNQGAQGGAASMNFDSNLGWSSESSWSNFHQSWMWKRGQGCDVVAYSGNGVDGRNLNHSLNQAPQMIWIKNRTDSGNTGDWMVGHKDLNGGSNPWNYYLVLNKTQGEYSDSNPFNNSAPTSTTFELDSWDRVNASGSDYVAFLFASANDADGNPISKVGSYTGDGTSDHEITTGFQPRFVLLKRASGTANWYLMDTLRGMGSTSTHRLKLNTDAAQDEPAGGPYVVPISTGFDVRKETSEWNNNGDTYIYYAHA